MAKVKIALDDAAGWRREAKKQKKRLKSLTACVSAVLDAVDEIMREPESEKRGRKIALIMNILDIENDAARYNELGVDWRKDKKKARPNAFATLKQMYEGYTRFKKQYGA
jgi:hypothetical protein